MDVAISVSMSLLFSSNPIPSAFVRLPSLLASHPLLSSGLRVVWVVWVLLLGV